MKMIVGIDIGGTKISGVLFDGKKVLKEQTVPTPINLKDFQEVLNTLILYLARGQKSILVGIGIAGNVDPVRKVVLRSPNIKFIKNLNLKSILKLKLVEDVKVDNDASCFTRAEKLVGQGKKLRNFLAMTLGTGIGGGVVINNELYRGKNNSGAEFGHIYLGSGFFESQFQVLRNKKDFVNAGKLIGKGLASLINIFAPEAVIIGGGYGINESGKYLPSAKKEIAKFIFNERNKTEVLISKLKNAGALGAALLFV